jgi:hypothetical protein
MRGLKKINYRSAYGARRNSIAHANSPSLRKRLLGSGRKPTTSEHR